MPLNYSAYTPAHLQYEYCPMCTSKLDVARCADGQARPQCPVCRWTYYAVNLLGVNIVITTPEGIVFTTPSSELAGNYAALPGGVIEFGETPEDAAMRAAREETGFVVKITRELGRQFDIDFPLGPMLSFMFEAKAVGGTLRVHPDMRVAVFPENQYPPISPRRKGSQRTLDAYIQLQRQTKIESNEE